MTLTFECSDCGYRWEQGFNGQHSCKPRLLKKLKDSQEKVEALKAELLELLSSGKTEETSIKGQSDE